MKTLFSALKLTIAFCVILFVGYVLPLWGFAYVVQSNSGQAEVLSLNGRIVGAEGVGQQFTQPQYFWGRPSAVDYNAQGSGGSNKAISNPEYLAQVELRIEAFLAAHPYLQRSQIPSEMVTSSGSGLDPHLSPKAVEVQIERVAQARAMSQERVAQIVEQNTDHPLVGQTMVNVLKLNIALDNETKN